MVRVRTLALSLLAVFAVGAVASASASAAGIEGWEEAVAGESKKIVANVELSEAPIVLAGDYVLRTANVETTCSELVIEKGFIGATGTNGAKSLKFKDCELITAPTKCKLSAANEAEIATTEVVSQLTGTVTGVGELAPGGENEKITNLKVKFKPKVGEEFTSFKIEAIPGQACLLAKTYKVKGSATAELANYTNDEDETAAQSTLKFTSTSGTELKAAEEAAEFLAEPTISRKDGKPIGICDRAPEFESTTQEC